MEQTGTPAAGPGAPGPGRRRHYRYRSLFWPVVLIGAGVMWLLYSLDVISASNLEVLALVWPVFVIGIGVDLMVGHRSRGSGRDRRRGHCRDRDRADDDRTQRWVG